MSSTFDKITIKTYTSLITGQTIRIPCIHIKETYAEYMALVGGRGCPISVDEIVGLGVTMIKSQVGDSDTGTITPLTVGQMDVLNESTFNLYGYTSSEVRLRKNTTVLSAVSSSDTTWIPYFMVMATGEADFNFYTFGRATTVNPTNYSGEISYCTASSYGYVKAYAKTPWQMNITTNSNDHLQNASMQEFYGSGSEPVPEDPDPFSPGGTSEPGGGNGTFNGTSDSNPIPGDPTISATDTGFMTVFATNTAGLRSLANSLWTDIFAAIQPGGTLEGTVEALKNIVASPYDAILGCHIVPVNVPVGSSRNVKMYGVLPSSVSLPVASSQWVHKDCGSLTIEPYDGSYLDYAPYSKVTSLYLPFVGVVSVDIDIIMNTTIGVYYKIDIVSGQCIVYVTKNGDVYFQYQGQCAVPIPVTSIDWSNTVSSGLGLIGSVTNIVGSAVGGALAGGPAGALSGAVTGTIGQAGSMAQNVMNSKPDIKAGSGVGGAAALMGCKSPYLIIERPRKSTPKKQNHYTGYPSNIRAKLGDLEGYTEVSRVYVNHMNATTEEKAEIERLLNEGVVL